MAGLRWRSFETRDEDVFLLIHTMTLRENGCVVEAQFLHAVHRGAAILVGKRLRMRVPRGGPKERLGMMLLGSQGLRSIVKRNAASVKHHLRAVHVNPQIQNTLVPKNDNVEVPSNVAPRNSISLPRESSEVASTQIANVHLNENSSPEETNKWLTLNRFDKYVGTFERFSGDDMLRMSREDLIQICGDADGIRLHNAIHMKTIAPKLKIYVRREDSPVFSAIFLSSHSNAELVRKLSTVAGLTAPRVRDVYVEGPHGIHVRLDDDLLRHVQQETMFALEVVRGREATGACVLLLKKFVK